VIYNINRSERFPQIQPWDFLVRLWGETVARCSRTLSEAPGELIPYGRPVALHRRRSYQIPHPSIWLLLEKIKYSLKKERWHCSFHPAITWSGDARCVRFMTVWAFKSRMISNVFKYFFKSVKHCVQHSVQFDAAAEFCHISTRRHVLISLL